MTRKQFLAITGGTIVVAGVTYYLSSDKSNFVRADTQPKHVETQNIASIVTPDEKKFYF